jgi:hypothetical protein
MANRPPIDSDLYTAVSLHSILEIEVAIRHIWLHHRKDLEAMRTVRVRAAELAKEIPVPDAGELMADVFFEAVELKRSPRHLIGQYTSSLDDNEFDLVNTALRSLWQEHHQEVLRIAANFPGTERFRLADLSWENDLPSLLDWCQFMRTAQPHEVGWQERIDEDGNKYKAYISIAMPARVPRERPYDNFIIYDADVDNVTVNGRTMHGASLLVVNTGREIDNFEDIVDSFGAHLGGKQAIENLRLLHNGILPTVEALSVFDYNRKLARQRDRFEVPPRRDRPEIMLKGLICWDLHKREGKKIDDACSEVGLILGYSPDMLPEEERGRIRNNYNSVRRQIQEGKLLPWDQRGAKNKR